MNPTDRLQQLRRMLGQFETVLESLESAFESARTDGPAETVAAEALRKVSRNQEIDEEEQLSLEAIVLPRYRPIVNIVAGTFAAPPTPWQHLASAQTKARIVAAIRSIGQIEVPKDPGGRPYAGTGFIVGPNLMMTNRHVAETFATGLGQRNLVFHPGRSVAVDFAREVVPSTPERVAVERVLMIHPHWDMALLRVAGLPSERAALTLSTFESEALYDHEVVVVGYPAMDARNDLSLQLKIFGGEFNVKRLAPGKLKMRRVVESFGHAVNSVTHDCSTLGCNSGSAVIEIASGDVVALHFAGEYLDANFAVPSFELARDDRIVQAGVVFNKSPGVQPSYEWLAAWQAADRGEAPEAGGAAGIPLGGSPAFNPETLPDWARASVAAAFEEAPKAVPSALSQYNATAWPLLLDAAVISNFLPRELAPNAVPGDARAGAEQVVLGFSEMTDGPDGVKWSLAPRARAEVVKTAQPTGELFEAIRRTSQRFGDPVSQALRKCLKDGPKSPADLESLAADPADLKSLEAIRSAIALLSGVTSARASRPQFEELDRKIGFQRLLAQFERMVEHRPEDAEAGRNRYFFGRDEEIEDLRGYVGVIAADSVYKKLKRGAKSVSRSILGRGAKTVWGVGGMGKTTLISKFMLDHARVAASRFPFAYLDFDRATVSARQRTGLLAEMCLQAGTQFQELSKPLGDLRAQVSQLAQRSQEPGDVMSIEGLAPHARKFRELVEGHLESIEKMLEWRRPFLLVFDTFEVVQYTPDDVEAMEEFVQAFSYPNESGLWPRLRLIIAGRKRVTSFVGDVEELALGALDAVGSAKLLMALARDAGKPLEESDATKLVAAVAKATKEENGGVQPLRLQLIGQVFKDNNTRADGPSIAESLVREMRQPLKADGLAAQVFIDGILIRRVLGHVSDRRVKALADPGLVVRRITVGVIQAVMTRGTSPPDAGEAPDADTEPTFPWVVDETEASSIFKAFAKEVSLVEPDRSAASHENADGEALRHRPDVRQQMLPLIRAARPMRFAALNRLAFDYFRVRAEADETDLASAAEAVYHGLWLNEPLSVLNRLWRSSPSFDPRIEPDEFDPQSLASIFLRAKSRSVLSPAEVSKLPHDMALDWLDARSTDLLESRRIEGPIQAVQAVAGKEYEHLDGRPEIAAVLARLMYRAGLWEDAQRLMWRHLEHASRKDLAGPKQSNDHETKAGSRSAAILSLLRTWTTIVAKGNGPAQSLEWAASVCPFVRDPLARVEIAAHVVVGVAQRSGQLRDTSEQLKSVFSESFGAIGTARWTKYQRILRLAAAAGCRPPELLEIWIEASVQVPRDVNVHVLIDLFLEVFQDLPTAVEVKKSARSKSKGEVFSRLDDLWLQEKATIVEVLRKQPRLRPRFWLLVTSDHSDWIRPLGNALTRALKGEQGDKIAQMLRSKRFLTDRIAQRRQRDGMAIAQFTTDDGRLLELASAMGTLTPHSRSDWGDERPTYPQGAFDIGNALSRWSTTISVASQEATPPAPGPVIHQDDPQKDRWGAQFEKAGRRLRVIVDTDATTRSLLWFNLAVDSVDGSQLEGPVIFHLHDTFSKSVIWIRRIRDDKTALLEDVNAEETFTVGVQVKDHIGQWIGLEFDLEQDPSIPSRFKPQSNRRK